MLKTIEIKLIKEDSKLVNANNIINGISNDHKVNRVLFQIDFQAKLYKSKNKIRPSLAKS